MEIRHMLAQYGQDTISQRKVYEWVERFKSGRTRVSDEGRSGWPSTSRTQDHIDNRLKIDGSVSGVEWGMHPVSRGQENIHLSLN